MAAGKELHTKLQILVPQGMPAGDWTAHFIALAKPSEFPAALALQGEINFEVEIAEGISRREAVAGLAAALRLEPALQKIFNDLEPQGEGALVAAAAKAGLVKGYPDGSFGTDRLLTRAEAALLLFRLGLVNANSILANAAVDIRPDFWAAQGIAAALAGAYLQTSPQGDFLPEQPMDRAVWQQVLSHLKQPAGRVKPQSGEEPPGELVTIPLDFSFSIHP